MGEDVTHKDICVNIDGDEEESGSKGISEAIKHIGDGLFKNYEDKTSFLSSDNILGTIQCDLINEHMKTAFGINFDVLDKIVSSVKSRRQSKDGYGKEKLIEGLQKLQATFESIEGDTRNRLPQRRF